MVVLHWGERTMAKVIARRVTARVEGDFVVFLIGMRNNKVWKLDKWMPVFLAMPRMIRELERRPDSGFLGHVTSTVSFHARPTQREAGSERRPGRRRPTNGRMLLTAGGRTPGSPAGWYPARARRG